MPRKPNYNFEKKIKEAAKKKKKADKRERKAEKKPESPTDIVESGQPTDVLPAP